jgi:hypothetical protein
VDFKLFRNRLFSAAQQQCQHGIGAGPPGEDRLRVFGDGAGDGTGASVALAGAVSALYGGSQAGAALLRLGAADTAHFQTKFASAFHMAMLTCMVVASIGVLTSLMRGQPQ